MKEPVSCIGVIRLTGCFLFAKLTRIAVIGSASQTIFIMHVISLMVNTGYYSSISSEIR